jgi:hypothetical protein
LGNVATRVVSIGDRLQRRDGEIAVTLGAARGDVVVADIVQAVFAGFRTLRTTHTADDVRRAIVKAFGTWAAVTLRDGGGIYWVPADEGITASDRRWKKAFGIVRGSTIAGPTPDPIDGGILRP